MKQSILSIKKSGIIALLALSATACNKFTDRPPLSNITPDQYLLREADLAAYTVTRYNFPTHSGWGPGTHSFDNHTDNQATSGAATRWAPGEWRVPQDGGSWNFGNIRQHNYYLETVVPRWKSGVLSGNAAAITHYIGEGYFLRAYEYFDKVQAFGDFPIIKQTLPDVREALVEASKRKPRNEVARFILSDLDSAISLLSVTAPQGAKNRLNKNAALLFKSRVALHEASWLTYHKGTAQVPGGPGWPGTGKVENFTINIDSEIDFFLTQAMDAASQVADAVQLVSNTKDEGYNSSSNPYFKMFGDMNLGGYSEVLLWRAYDASKGINHNVGHYVNQNGGNTGFTRGLVDNFLMANGLPIYAVGSGYQGDDMVNDVKVGRDNRLQLFMKVPGELRFTDKQLSGGTPILEGNPDIIGLAETRYVTGYALKKGMSYLSAQAEGNVGATGSIVFRAAEAYLNYIEASYMKEKTINGKADQYWRALRNRAGVNPDYMTTVAATDMTEEAKNDFGAYSAGQLLNDPILYNIRRERRSELIAEGMRYFDLKRWRALDQLKSQPYHIEGFKVWGPMQDWYDNPGTGESRLIEAGTPGRTANVSKKSESEYLRPYRVNLTSSNFWVEGYKWAYAHYLEPIAINHFLQSAQTQGETGSSVIYQNPGWPMEANVGAIE
ncbi:RagB/SusD family nutrient uptake outer membrane protein [Flavihumibacter sp. UBA7668]|uniref:RagB/SusD family nutrient uptake outer membrane protein n=1 Tax=Flavihumibacter sp. UBA7668 TaxID=1946542 RepID=UPI0025BF6123|nr:RagB/SusD family nutrient uptake outer membrane protein [Flavihumibacter sp. UBA7668]